MLRKAFAALGSVAALVLVGAAWASALKPLANPAAVTPVPAVVQHELRAELISVSPAVPASTDVAPARAIRIAVSWAPTLGGRPVGVRAFRVRYTDPYYGKTISTGGVRPFNVNKAAWLVLIPNTINFISGPPSRKGPNTYRATLAVFVAATTGRVIQAITIGA